MASGANTFSFPWTKVSGSYDAVIILYKFFELTNDQRYEVFRRVVLPEAQQIRPGCDISRRNFFELYDRREEPKRPAWNRVKDLDDPSDEELSRRLETRASMHEKLRQGMKDMGIWSADMDLALETESETEDPVNNVEESEDEEGNVEEGNFEEGYFEEGNFEEGDGEEQSDITSVRSLQLEDYQLEDDQLEDNASWFTDQQGTFFYEDNGSSSIAGSRHNRPTGLQQSKQQDNAPHESFQTSNKPTNKATQYLASPISDPSHLSPLHSPSAPAALSSSAIPPINSCINDTLKMPTRNVSTRASTDTAKLAAANDTAPAPLTPPTTADKLKMLHQRGLIWQNGTPVVHEAHYASSDDPAYHRGGKVFRVIIDNHQEDIMICAGCFFCQNGKEPIGRPKLTEKELAAQAANSATQGLPFVHTNDIGVDKEHMDQPKRFLGTASGWRPDHPAMMQTTMTFTSGNIILNDVAAMQCIFDTCSVCKPSMDMDALLRSWKPGGEEYERDKAERAKYEQMRKEYVATLEAEVDMEKKEKNGTAEKKIKVKKEGKGKKE